MTNTEENTTEDQSSKTINASYDPMVGHPKRNAILAVMCLSLVVIVLDNSILNVAIPTISDKLKTKDTDLIWIIDAYTIIFAGLLLTCGTIGDKFGRRLALQTGLFIFGTASFLSSFAQNPMQLTIGRAVMGIGGALIMPATLSIITNVFPPKERGKAIGIWAAFAGVGVAIGPLTGGFLIEHFWWGSVFMVNVPFVVGGIIANSMMVPESKHEDATKLDIIGAALSIVGLSSLLYGIIFGADTSFKESNVLIAFVIAFISIISFFIWESKVDHAMLELHFFKDKRFSSGALSITLLFFAMFGMSFLLSQYLQSVLGYSALKSGVGFIPFALGMIITAPSSAKVSAKIGTKSTVLIGLSLVSVALFSMTTLEVGGTYLHVVWMMVLMSLGTGLTMAPATSAIMNSVPREKAGVGSAMNDTTRMIGGALGLAITGSIFSSYYQNALDKDMKLSSLFTSMGKNGMNESTMKVLSNSISGSIGQAIGTAKAYINPSLVSDESAQAGINMIPKTERDRIAATIIDSSRHSFVHGLHAGVTVAGIATLIGIVIAFILMPQNSMSENQEAGHAH
ncbi:MAG: MFS transporter [Acidimicrobiia bacterium]|nr:MFS transporter [Acidimicrobiia bacterium]